MQEGEQPVWYKETFPGAKVRGSSAIITSPEKKESYEILFCLLQKVSIPDPLPRAQKVKSHSWEISGKS